MVPFNVKIELENNVCEVLVEQLDRLADVDGFICFDVACGERRAAIYVNVENDLPPVTPQDAEAYFQAVHYPEQLPAFSIDEDFKPEEVRVIANAIRQYNKMLRFSFNKFMSQTSLPDL